MVDDGSPGQFARPSPASWPRADPNLRVIELSRNFGHHKALMTGLNHATGDYCFLIDSDLEEDPALLVAFYPLKSSATGTLFSDFRSASRRVLSRESPAGSPGI